MEEKFKGKILARARPVSSKLPALPMPSFVPYALAAWQEDHHHYLHYIDVQEP